MRWRLALGLALGAVLLAANPGSAGILDATWTAPTTNTDGSPLTDLASYRVYHGTGSAPCPGPTFSQVASSTASPPANQTVSFRLTGLSAGTTNFVAITAVDTGGMESACSSTANAPARITFAVSPTGAVNFGSVNLGAFADQTFTVQNISGGTVSGAVSVPAPFNIVSGSPFTLVGLNATQTVTVRFRPTTTATATVNTTFSADGDAISRNVSGTGTTPNALALTSLTANLTAPQPPGSTVTFTAAATGGTAPYQFKWWLDDGATFTML